MFKQVCLSVALLLMVTCGWSQETGDNMEDRANPVDDVQMLTPPPVGGTPYSTALTSENQSNYLKGTLALNTGYSDNILGGVTASPISDVSYSVWPTIELGRTTPRWNSTLTYSSGFTFYQRTDARDETNQNLGLNFQWRLSPHITATFHDSFAKSSDVFNQPDPISANAVFGSGQVPTQAVIPPVADQLTNAANVALNYQFGPNEMIGVGGTFANLHYPDPAEVPGLYDSSSRAGTAFYSRRFSKRHYLGASYQYANIASYPIGSPIQTETSTVFLFYTIFLSPTLSFSASGGPQYFQTAQGALPGLQSWSPAATASFGWQARRIALSASYSRLVTAGGGLIGAFYSNAANAAARWQAAKTWTVGSFASYSIDRSVEPALLSAGSSGQGVSGTVLLQHRIGEHFSAEVGYSRLHQNYGGIAAIAGAPNVNREYVSISYWFSRPLGR